MGDDPADIGAVDLVVVAVKTWQVPEVARAPLQSVLRKTGTSGEISGFKTAGKPSATKSASVPTMAAVTGIINAR